MTTDGINTAKAKHQISPIPPMVIVGGVVTFIVCPLWMMFVGGLITGFSVDSVGIWVAASIYLFMVIVGGLFRVVFVTPIRFHEGPPEQDRARKTTA